MGSFDIGIEALLISAWFVFSRSADFGLGTLGQQPRKPQVAHS